jgi:penicillin-binding protein 1C
MKSKIKSSWQKIIQRFPTKKSRLIATGIIGGLIFLLIFIYFTIFYNLPSPQSLRDYKIIPISTQIYDRNGKLLYEFYRDQNRTPIKLNSLPKYVSQATIAIEDKDFYHHGGVSLISGMLRAAKDTLLRQQLQGGSTLTQQLVKGALLSQERTVQRKIKEIILSMETEQLFTKDQILEMYLNQVPYGGSSYGIEESARTHFDKHAKDLTLAEAALLAGLPQAPSTYSPFANPDLANQRKNTVLDKMYEQNYITKSQRDAAKNKATLVRPPTTTIRAPHFVFYVKAELEKKYDIHQIEEGGLRVTTTLDLDLQEQSEKILRDELEKDKYLDVSNGAILVTRPPTGEIISMVGSADYFATPSDAFNVTTALRQPGSSIKPLNYAVGLDRELVTPASVFIDEPTCFAPAGQPKQYCPVNYDGTFHGLTQLRFALGNSYNIPAVKMLAMNGVDNFIASASAFTITSFKDPVNYGLSLTLGGGEVRMTEMAQAFSTFANRGKPKKLVSILEIKDKSGKVLEKFENPNYVQDLKKPLDTPNFFSITGKQVLKPETTYLISHILLDNNARSAAFGPSSFLVIPNHAVSVKTGTTDDKKDNWTIGYTPNFLTVVWVGNNDNTPMNPYLTSGITGAAPIWNQVMAYALKNQPDLWPIKPENVIPVQVCTDTGAIANKNPDGTASSGCPTRFEYIMKGTENKGPNIKKETVPVSRDNGEMVKPDAPNVEMKEKMILDDGFSKYCLDCAHPALPTPKP